MIATLWLLSVAARADEAVQVVEVPDRALLWSLPRGVVRALRRGVPAGRPGEAAAACRATFRWAGQVSSVEVDACPGPLVPAVRAAADAWVFDAAGEVDGLTVDVWTVFHSDGRVETLLAPSPVPVTARDPGVGAMGWQLQAARWPLHPDGTEKGRPGTPAGTPTTCLGRVRTDSVGNVDQVEVRGCPQAFAERAREALDAWRLAPLAAGEQTLPVSATLEIVFEPAFDGAPPTVSWKNPLPPDLGDRPVAEAPPSEVEAPEGEPILRLRRPPYAEVKVHAIGWPEPLALGEEASCDLLLQVNSEYKVWVWPERCDPAVAPAVDRAASGWVLSPGDRAPGELYARFRATLAFRDGEVRLWVPERDLPAQPLPDRVGTWAPATPTVRVPPRLPQGAEVPDGGLVCEVDVRISDRGRPSSVGPMPGAEQACPQPFLGSAVSAVRRWRWTPARAAGIEVQSDQRVSVEFRG